MCEIEVFRRYGTYNMWMNDQLLGACYAIADDKRKEDLGAFFGSIHDTFVHVLLADKYRMHQFEPSDTFWPGVDSQDDFSEWDALCSERQACDARMGQWLADLAPETLERTVVTGSWVDKNQHAYPLWLLLMHSLNHQVHHRGQITTLMSQLGVDFGVTGFAWQPDLLSGSIISDTGATK
jgi:uncharacterized damage-inducible protein DinB